MTWRITSPIANTQPIDENSTTKRHTLGTIVTAKDETLGGGEFIYLQGIGSTVVGSAVTYSAATFLTALGSITGGTSDKFAVAMAATVASEYGWYQISGRATIKKASALSIAAGTAVGITSGLLVAASTAKRLVGAVTGAIVASGATTGVIFIDRPASSPELET